MSVAQYAAEPGAGWTAILQAGCPDPASLGNPTASQSSANWGCHGQMDLHSPDLWPQSSTDGPIPWGMNQIGELLLPGRHFGIHKVELKLTPPIPEGNCSTLVAFCSKVATCVGRTTVASQPA